MLIDWPHPGVPRALFNAGFTVFGYSPYRYSMAQLVDELPQGTAEKDSFPPRNKEEKGYLIFQKLDYRPESVDIVNVYRPEEELPRISLSKPCVAIRRESTVAASTGYICKSQQDCSRKWHYIHRRNRYLRN